MVGSVYADFDVAPAVIAMSPQLVALAVDALGCVTAAVCRLAPASTVIALVAAAGGAPTYVAFYLLGCCILTIAGVALIRGTKTAAAET